MPKLSVVVPTRERSDTLFFTIKTLVQQDYQNCEFIISDNASVDDTFNVVHSFMDQRIRYINTDRRLSMSDNWEFALQHVRGEYVTYIGDDDGFLPGALKKAMTLLEDSKIRALVWDKAEYCWPDYVDENMRNWFSIKLGASRLELVSGRKRLTKVLKFHEGYNRLPCLYNGIIKKSLLDDVISYSTNGLFFNAVSPDVYSGIALSAVVEEYLLTDYPFSVNGASRHSNGTAFVRPRNKVDSNDNPTNMFLSENSRVYDKRVKLAPTPVTCVMGELLLAKRFLPKLMLPEPNWNVYLRALIRSAKNSLAAEQIFESAAYSANILSRNVIIPKYQLNKNKVMIFTGFTPTTFNFRVPESMVSNVYDACQLIGHMIPEKIGRISNSIFLDFFSRIWQCVQVAAIRLYRSL